MDPRVEVVREAVHAGGLLDEGRPVLAMLSGGRDSVCLLDVALALSQPGHVSALHINYGLREQADAEEAHCAALCGRLGVKLEVVREGRPRRVEELPGEELPGEGLPGVQPHARDAARRGSGNLQAWAREVRYREARRVAERSDALIATGHTASDQVETILYRLAASPGRRALLGMKPNATLLLTSILP